MNKLATLSKLNYLLLQELAALTQELLHPLPLATTTAPTKSGMSNQDTDSSNQDTDSNNRNTDSSNSVKLNSNKGSSSNSYSESKRDRTVDHTKQWQRFQRLQQVQELISLQEITASIPATEDAQWQLFRALVNMREARPIVPEFIALQDKFLQAELKRRGVTSLASLTPLQSHPYGNIYLWQGDITTLQVDAIVNAANSGLTGCYYPGHRCIDNAIHTFAGVELRLACAQLMQQQGYPEPTGQAKITPAFNLPSRYVIHTVGPIITGALTQHDCELLASCYRSCLELAQYQQLSSIAFCCISTGEFHFPPAEAARIAIATVTQLQQKRWQQWLHLPPAQQEEQKQHRPLQLVPPKAKLVSMPRKTAPTAAESTAPIMHDSTTSSTTTARSTITAKSTATARSTTTASNTVATGSLPRLDVVFNVFKDEDYELYHRLLKP